MHESLKSLKSFEFRNSKVTGFPERSRSFPAGFFAKAPQASPQGPAAQAGCCRTCCCIASHAREAATADAREAATADGAGGGG